jgi:eukaryotic-like serine/threonine-protein kinase
MIEAMSAAAISREWVGRLADGRFPLLQWLGGSESTGVFLTELADRRDQSQKAVIKLVPAEAEDAEARVAAWEAATSLSHPNLMKVFTHGSCEIDDLPCLYVVTEFADEVLAEIISERPLTTKETRDLLGPTLDALSYLHANGLVHGRLNPSNIMAAGDSLKLTTYGVCSVGTVVTSSSTRTVCDAPETENGQIGPASDIWSLGATLVEVLTKYPPEWNRARTAEPTVPESMPEPFASIARKCLRSDSARRITLDEIAARLEPAKFPPAPPEKEIPTAKRRIALPIAIAALVLALAGIWFALSHRAQPPSPAQQAQNLPPAAPVQMPNQTPVQAPAPQPTATPSRTTTPGGTATKNPAQATPPASTTATPPASKPASVAAPVPPPQPAAQATDNPSAAPATINPAVVSQIFPDIIPSAMRTISGKVKVSVRLAVDENGIVTDATLTSAGPSNYFASKSLEAARHWKFRPAQVDGHAAPSNWILEFQYRRSGINVIPRETTP